MQVKLVGHEIDVSQNFWLGRIELRPFPLALDLVGKRKGILHAFDIAAGSRIAIPVPRAADRTGRLQHANRISVAAQSMKRIQTGKARANDDDVQMIRFLFLAHHELSLSNLSPRRLSQPYTSYMLISQH